MVWTLTAMEGFASSTVGMMPLMIPGHHALDTDDFFQSSMAADLAPPNLEQLAAMGAQHEPQLNMDLFYGTPLYDPYQHNNTMHMPQHMLMQSMPTHMHQHHMLSRDGSTPIESSSLDQSVGMPPVYSLTAAHSQDASAPMPVKSNRGRKPLPRTSEERMLATQEKNRRAQRKFRCGVGCVVIAFFGSYALPYPCVATGNGKRWAAKQC